MAYRESDVWKILSVLDRTGRGQNISRVSAELGLARKTVRRYLKEAYGLGWTPGVEPSEAVASQVLAKVRPGPKVPEHGEAVKALLSWQEQIATWLRDGREGDRRGLTLAKVRKLLRAQGLQVPYSTLHRFAAEHCGFHRHRITVRLDEVEPGSVAQVDFGRLGLVPDVATGRKRVCHALIVTLVHSRHQFVHVTFSQRLEDLIAGLEDAWWFFGGVPARTIIDNMKAAVIKADRYEPIFQRSFEEYSRWRGFVIDPAVPSHATGKPHVERAVPYVRENFFRGETWRDLEHVQREVRRWCTDEAGQRIHGTTQQPPLQVFEAVERQALRPLERERFDPPTWHECKVHPDHHLRVGKALYSVPTRFVGQQVVVRKDSRLVRIYCRGECIKTHPARPPGRRSTDHSDYPKEKTSYTLRDPIRITEQALESIGPQAGAFVRLLLPKDFPWSQLRQAQGLLGLAKKYGAERIEAACARAVEYGAIRLSAVRNIVEKAIENDAPQGPTRQAPLSSRFQRPAGSFALPVTPMKEETLGTEPLVEDRPEAPEAVRHPGHASGPDRVCPASEVERAGAPGTGTAG